MSNLFLARCYILLAGRVTCFLEKTCFLASCSEERLNMEMQFKALINLTSQTNGSNQNLLSRITYIWYVL